LKVPVSNRDFFLLNNWCSFAAQLNRNLHGSSSTGRVAVSKTVGCGFDPYLPCYNFQTEIMNFAEIKEYVTSSVDEVKNKVTWPAYSDLQSSTVLVLVASLILSLLLGLVDFVFENGMNWFYRSF
jgi:preprotein translocase subunit SecE